MAFSTVYSCVSAISGDIAKLARGLRLRRRTAKGGMTEAKGHPISRLLWRPNHYQTMVDFLQYFMVSALLTGNAYAWKERDKRGVVSSIYCLDPRRVQVLVADTGDVFYRLAKDKLAGMGNVDDYITVPASEIIHHRLMCLEHPLVGVTPLYAAGVSAQVGARIMMNSTNFFGNHARPSGILSAPGKISPDTAKLLKQQWEDNFGAYSGGVGRAAVLGNGLKWETLTMTSVDAQLIDQLRWSVEDVARAFRVPLFVIGGEGKVTYRNSEQQNRAYYAGCLQYHIESLEFRFDEAFDLAEDVFIDFDLDPMLRTEMDIRFTAWKTAITGGFKTINEVRLKEGDEPIEGGDEPLVQIQYQPLSTLGKLPPPATPPAPAPGDEPPSDDGSTPPDSNQDDFDIEQMTSVLDGAIAHGFAREVFA